MGTQALLVAIIQREDKESANAALTHAGFQVTHISSVGGFLQVGNATLLIGLEHSEIARAVRLLATTCRKRIAFVNTALEVPAVGMQYAVMPVEAEVGGGTLFVLPVERFIRLGSSDREILAETCVRREQGMKLIMAIMPEELSKTLVQALTAAQYRATQISTTGGFLRQGNATLLIGVESNAVDEVLTQIQDTCHASRTNGSATTASATIFVLAVEQYLHL